MSYDEFKNKTVLITGAGSGIGLATAELFASLGAHVVLNGRDVKRLKKAEAACEKLGDGKVTVFAADLTDPKKVTELFKSLKDLDVAVNNAGFEGQIGEIADLSLEDFDAAMGINVRALFQCMQEEIKFFRKKKKPGAIVNVSSIAALIGLPSSSLYVAAKHAVNGLTKAAALEQIQYKIRINAVCPGATETGMLSRIYKGDLKAAAASNPIGRLGEPKEIADAIAWLASGHSSFVVGHCLVADGGRTV
jgi:NAD(P)-dependent dehydrogenase (short-subunit alcohol dehydrogenase family)